MTDATDPTLVAIRERLEAFLRSDRSDAGLSVDRVAPVPDGHSGFTYFVDAHTGSTALRYVLRVPPPGARAAGPADVIRQGRIMRALASRRLPVPRIVASCEDPAVLDGRPFILMERIAGASFREALATYGSAAIAGATVECLRRVHAVPRAESGLAGEEPMPLGGELDRWSALMQRGVSDLVGGASTLAERLRARMPAPVEPVLVHGDYHYGNLLFGGAEVVAILDWEIAQVGQPLLDLATLCVIADRRAFATDPNPGGAVEVTSEELVRLYGADPEAMTWYLALGCYKYAAIFAYNLGLHRRGKRVDPHYEELAPTITGLIARGRDLVS